MSNFISHMRYFQAMTGSEQAAAEDAPTTPSAGMPVPQDWKGEDLS
jgi:hypothetical protein